MKQAKLKNTTLLEQFQNPIKKIADKGKIDTLTNIYMTAHKVFKCEKIDKYCAFVPTQ